MPSTMTIARRFKRFANGLPKAVRENGWQLDNARLCMKHSGEFFIQDVDTYPILAAASMPLYVALQCTPEYMVHEHLEDYDDGLIYL